MAKVSFTYRLEREQLEKFRYIAKVKDTNMNTLLTNFLVKYVESYEEKNGYIDPVMVELELKEEKNKK